MKLEKISENQIRCTLTQSDLVERHMNIHELSYGSEKAKRLFREMVSRASYELDCDLTETPVLIEAVPLALDSIMLLITKIDDPEELNPRFAKFAPNLLSTSNDEDEDLSSFEDGSDEETPFIPSTARADKPINPAVGSRWKLYAFSSLDALITAAHAISHFPGASRVYKENANSLVLALEAGALQDKSFYQYANVLAEFTDPLPGDDIRLAYLDEHVPLLIPEDAVSRLSRC